MSAILKGIIFVVVIIITFDIGVTLVEKYFGDENSQEAVRQLESDEYSMPDQENSEAGAGFSNEEQTEGQSIGEGGPSRELLEGERPKELPVLPPGQEDYQQSIEMIESGEAGEAKTLLNLELPEGIPEDDDETLTSNGKPLSETLSGDTEKKVSVKAKPNIKFKSGTVEPEVSGATVDMKVKTK